MAEKIVKFVLEDGITEAKVPTSRVIDADGSTTLSAKLNEIGTSLASKADTTALDEYLKSDTAASTYATKTELEAKADTTSVEAKADKTELDSYLKATDAANTYVAKEEGKGLSTWDYTLADKQKLSDIPDTTAYIWGSYEPIHLNELKSGSYMIDFKTYQYNWLLSGPETILEWGSLSTGSRSATEGLSIHAKSCGEQASSEYQGAAREKLAELTSDDEAGEKKVDSREDIYVAFDSTILNSNRWKNYLSMTGEAGLQFNTVTAPDASYNQFTWRWPSESSECPEGATPGSYRLVAGNNRGVHFKVWSLKIDNKSKNITASASSNSFHLDGSGANLISNRGRICISASDGIVIGKCGSAEKTVTKDLASWMEDIARRVAALENK